MNARVTLAGMGLACLTLGHFARHVEALSLNDIEVTTLAATVTTVGSHLAAILTVLK